MVEEIRSDSDLNGGIYVHVNHLDESGPGNRTDDVEYIPSRVSYSLNIGCPRTRSVIMSK
jgi:hypothetical protein